MPSKRNLIKMFSCVIGGRIACPPPSPHYQEYKIVLVSSFPLPPLQRFLLLVTPGKKIIEKSLFYTAEGDTTTEKEETEKAVTQRIIWWRPQRSKARGPDLTDVLPSWRKRWYCDGSRN